MAKNKFSYKSFVDNVSADLIKEEKRILKEAATHVRDKMKIKVKNKFKKISGNLLKGIGYKVIDRDLALVGAGPPAYQAHLLELGTMERKTKKGYSKGKITKTPFIVPTFAEEAGPVKKIMLGLSI